MIKIIPSDFILKEDKTQPFVCHFYTKKYNDYVGHFRGNITNPHDYNDFLFLFKESESKKQPKIIYKLKPEQIEWVMPWSSKYNKDKPDEEMFEDSLALAHLLMNEVVFINSYWYEKTLPEKFKKSISVSVNCNDVFAWGCADAEDLPYDQLKTLYQMWKKDPSWGSAVWCLIQRNQMPQKPVEDLIRKEGIWDLDSLNLGSNTQDAYIQNVFAQHLISQRSIVNKVKRFINNKFRKK